MKPLTERLLSKSERVGECLLWTGADKITPGPGEKPERVRRVAYQEWVGSIPDGHNIFVRCGNERCINPEHLMTGAINSTIQHRYLEASATGFSPLEAALYRVLSKTIANAPRRGLDVHLELDDLVNIYRMQSGKCYYTGLKLGDGARFRLSIDRVDSDKGYTVENCVLCIPEVNMCKHRFTEEDFISLCISVANKWNHLDTSKWRAKMEPK